MNNHIQMMWYSFYPLPATNWNENIITTTIFSMCQTMYDDERMSNPQWNWLQMFSTYFHFIQYSETNGQFRLRISKVAYLINLSKCIGVCPQNVSKQWIGKETINRIPIRHFNVCLCWHAHDDDDDNYKIGGFSIRKLLVWVML